MKNMRTAFVLITLVISSFQYIYAQGRPMQIYVLAGYQFNGRMDFYEGNFKMQDKGNWGVGLDVETQPGMNVGFEYSRSNTSGHFSSYYPITYPDRDADLTVDYFQLAIKRGQTKGPLEGYGLFSLGATWFNMLEEDIEDGWMFSMALGAGVNYFLTDKFGIKLQGRLLMPMYFAGMGMFVGIGGGGVSTGVSANAWAPVVQGDLTGGLVFRMGK
jgi:opacity protein-like surface antigen